MIYFTTEKLTNSDNLEIEKSIRRFSSKRHVSLDLKRTSVLKEEESKYFLGIENTKYLKITRLRGPLEKYLPKLIIRFSKSDFKKYDVRFSLSTFLITFILVLNFINELISILYGKSSITRLLLFSTILMILVFLTKLELKFVKKKINKSINNS